MQVPRHEAREGGEVVAAPVETLRDALFHEVFVHALHDEAFPSTHRHECGFGTYGAVVVLRDTPSKAPQEINIRKQRNRYTVCHTFTQKIVKNVPNIFFVGMGNGRGGRFSTP